MKNPILLKARKAAGFTLIEILVVLAIVAALIAFTLPSIEPALKGSKLKQAGEELEAALATARQVAITTNSPVEFRFYKFTDEAKAGGVPFFRAYQAVQLLADARDTSFNRSNAEVFPVTEVISMPGTYVILEDDEYSNLVTDEQLLQAINYRIPRAENAEYKAFQFGADGSTNLKNSSVPNWVATIVDNRFADGLTDLPDEFITVEVDAVTGKIRKFQF